MSSALPIMSFCFQRAENRTRPTEHPRNNKIEYMEFVTDLCWAQGCALSETLFSYLGGYCFQLWLPIGIRLLLPRTVSRRCLRQPCHNLAGLQRVLG